jgi:hypothetical protein
MRYFGVLCVLTAVSAQAQTEVALKAFFEGKKVSIKLDLPAGKDGMDINPRSQPIVDFKRYSNRLKSNGPALLKGDSATLSAVHVNEKSIQFQISGGVYGSLSDDIPHSISVPETPKQYSRGNARINLWYQDNSLKTTIPAPEELLQILGEYLDFGRGEPRPSSQVSSMRSDSSAKLKKGMTEGQVLNLFGAPRQSRVHEEGKLKVVTNTFQSVGESIEVDFVKNVVIGFRIRPR